MAENNIAASLAQTNVVAGGGSWLAPASDIRAGNWVAITEQAGRIMGRITPNETA